MNRYTDERGEVLGGKVIRDIILAIVALVLVFGSMFTVRAGEMGVVLRFGEIKRTADEGLHFKIPLIEGVKKTNVRTAKIEREASSSSKDLQVVTTQVALNYNVNPGDVADLYRQVGKKYESRIIDPAIQDAVKASTAQFNAEELITKRAEVKDLMEADLTQRLQSSGLVVTAMNIVNFQFSAEFDNAIEQKVTAEQNALKAENDLKRIEFEAQQRIEEAKAEAEAIRIQAQAINSQGGEDYVQLQAIEKWDGILPAQFVPGSAIPFLSI